MFSHFLLAEKGAPRWISHCFNQPSGCCLKLCSLETNNKEGVGLCSTESDGECSSLNQEVVMSLTSTLILSQVCSIFSLAPRVTLLATPGFSHRVCCGFNGYSTLSVSPGICVPLLLSPFIPEPLRRTKEFMCQRVQTLDFRRPGSNICFLRLRSLPVP